MITNNGEVLRFIGDAIFATFAIDVEDTSKHATIKTAAAILHDTDVRLLRINETCIADSKPAISIGVGLQVGKVL